MKIVGMTKPPRQQQIEYPDMYMANWQLNKFPKKKSFQKSIFPIH